MNKEVFNINFISRTTILNLLYTNKTKNVAIFVDQYTGCPKLSTLSDYYFETTLGFWGRYIQLK